MVSDPPDGVVCDLDGVLYRGEEAIDGSVEAIARLRARGIRLLFCSNNSSATIAGYRAKLSAHGVDASAKEILTSAVVLGDVLRRDLTPGAGVLCIGGAGMREAVVGAGHELVTDADAEVVVVGFDVDFNYEAMRTATLAVRAGARFYASNADASFPAPDGQWPGAGAILASIETASSARAVVVGKPEDPMRVAAAERLIGCDRIAVVGDERLIGCDRIAVVGDRAETDIAMGRAMGWGTVLVLSGVTTEDQLDGLHHVPDEVAARLAEVSWAQ